MIDSGAPPRSAAASGPELLRRLVAPLKRAGWVELESEAWHDEEPDGAVTVSTQLERSAFHLAVSWDAATQELTLTDPTDDWEWTENHKSIFAWVVEHFGVGWLLCDDGPGKAADFIHLADKDKDAPLTAIHVRAAHSTAQGRHIAVTAFEQVASPSREVRPVAAHRHVGCPSDCPVHQASSMLVRRPTGRPQRLH